MGCGASSPFQTKAPGDTNISWTPAASSAAFSVTSPTAAIRRKAPVESRSSSSVGRGMSRYPHLRGRLVRTRSATADASAPVLGSLAMTQRSTRCACRRVFSPDARRRGWSVFGGSVEIQSPLCGMLWPLPFTYGRQTCRQLAQQTQLVPACARAMPRLPDASGNPVDACNCRQATVESAALDIPSSQFAGLSDNKVKSRAAFNMIDVNGDGEPRAQCHA